MSCEVSSTTPMRPPPVPLAPHSSSSSLAAAGQSLGHHNASAEDIGALVGDSFSDVPSDDSGSWMNRVDVSNFAELTAPQPNASAAVPATVLALDHGLYAASAGRQRSSESCRITETGHSAGLQPSPDSSQPEALAVKTEDEGTRDRTSFGSVDQPRDFAAEAAADNAARAAVAQEGVGGFPLGQTMLAPLPALVTATSVRPKPSLSYSCLIALALKNSTDGRLTVAEIYNFMCENFPYFRSAPAGWKNSVRHNLSLNKCFEKIEVEAPGGHGRKSCLWTMNPNKIAKMENEVKKSREKDPSGVVEALATPHPEEMELLERGLKGMPGDAFDFGLRRDGQPPLQAVYQAQAYASPHRPHGPPHQTEMVSVSPAPPGTPPRPQLSSPAHSATAPRHFSTPTQAHRPPSAATAHQAPPHASSPYPQTPPFSPSLHSPRHHLHVGTGHGHWATSTPHVAAMHSPFSSGYGSSVGGAAADFVALSPSRLTPYDTMANALNNNSLLQTALAHSPCRLQLQSSALPLQTL